MSDTISRDEAIDRMKAGLPCETYNEARDRWNETAWAHFDMPNAKFRKPPEPRRVAVDFWIFEGGAFNHKVHPDAIHAREVLPGDVVLQRMTLNEARAKLREWGVSNNDAAGGAMTTLIEFGLIGEGS